ncbi:hypothetical protein IID19_03795 [Patescibacteria group bacterium]|nr:hypothetical protein [Patescibacteria group bacterium]
MSTTIYIRKKNYSGSVHITNHEYKIESDNFLLYRTLEGAMRKFWKKGIGAVQSNHGVSDRAIQLKSIVYKKENPEFINVIANFFRHMFGSEAVSVESDKTVLREKKNQIRRTLSRYSKLPGASTALRDIGTTLERVTEEQADILIDEIK